MTKEEFIKEKYGEHYDACKPDENGWSYFEYDPKGWSKGVPPDSLNLFGEDVEIYTKGLGDIWRPIALKGLEENNGWNKIDENGWPSEKGRYDFFKWPNITYTKCLWTPDSQFYRDCTHWRPVDDRLPIY